VSKAAGTSPSEARKIEYAGYIIFFGEDDNDREALKRLTLSLLRKPDQLRPKSLRKPISLIKGIERAKQIDRVAKVRATIRAINVQAPVRAIIFHQDADDYEPAHTRVEDEIRQLYASLPGAVVAAVPAWELEAWWFLFPTAVGSVRESWQDPNHYVGKDVGKIRNAKERLKECVRPTDKRRNSRFPDYQESDSPLIAEKVVTMGLIRKPSGHSRSWTSFVNQLDALERES